MINLIPNEEKKRMRKDFFLRLLIVLFFMLSFSFLIASVAVFPSLVLSYQNKILITKKLENEKNQKIPEVDEKAQNQVTELNEKLNLIEKAINNKYIFSEKVIDEILQRKIAGIKITKIFYQNDEFKGRIVTINGLANNREQLLLFRKSFEESTLFKDVNLPISNFVKDRNIQFNLNLSVL